MLYGFDNFLFLQYNDKVLNEIIVSAPAKVNFGLKVLPKRDDGFHSIESVFQTVSLCDEIAIKKRNDKKCVVFSGDFKLPPDNTITLAYNAFFRVTEAGVFGVDVALKKQIPSGGGLGGGSSDAAAFIKALAKMCGLGLTLEQKKQIAVSIGSDVFFFLLADTGCAVVSGRGEFVKQIEPRYDFYLLLVFPGVHSSTKDAYRLIDNSEFRMEYPAFAELEKIYRMPFDKWNFVNSFTPAISGKYNAVADALHDVKNIRTCCYAEMTGSGSTVYGVFTSEKEAIDACNIVEKSWHGCAVVKPVQLSK